MPDPSGYVEAIRLFENNLELVGKDNDQVLRNLSVGLYHLTVRLQADMTTLKENVGAGFHLGNTPETEGAAATA